jgi:anthranilate synthase component 2/para-aminobenzoate synthetase component 2
MILILDNYDSFVFNIVRYCEELGAKTLVRRNDQGELADIEVLRPDAIIISPGPCGPNEAGLSLAVINRFSGHVPLLGICLGHQCIGAAFGGTVSRAKRPMHGIASGITHDGTGVFVELPQDFAAGRYHSLIVTLEDEATSPLRITARSDEGEIMGLAHRKHPIFGVQFHPESILTEPGHKLIGNFLNIVKRTSDNAVV